MNSDLSDKTPNAETLASFKEIEDGGGEMFDGPSWAIFSSILAEEDSKWSPMESAPRDRFVMYRLADGGGERRGCIDTVAPKRVWVVFQLKGGYWPIEHFSGWKPLSDAAVKRS